MRFCFTLMVATLLLLGSTLNARAELTGERDCEYATQCVAVMVGCGCCGEDGQFVVINTRTIPAFADSAKCSAEQLKACSKKDCGRLSTPLVSCENKTCVMKPRPAEATAPKPQQ